MPHLPENRDPLAWHRYFAMEANNRAWALSVESRSAAQDLEMLHTAHASAWHWDTVGTELNRMRAKMLLAEVHALLAKGETALNYATEMRDYFLARETADWGIAFAHAIYAHAAWVAGDREGYLAAHHEAVAAMDAIADPQDRELVMLTFEQVPAP